MVTDMQPLLCALAETITRSIHSELQQTHGTKMTDNINLHEQPLK